MSDSPHIADAEQAFFVIAVTPDMCRVGKKIVAFKPVQFLPPEERAYSTTVFARGEKVLMVKSIISGVTGNAGKGLASQVSLRSGHSKIVEGSRTVLVQGRRVARDGDEVDMNGRVI
jgi:hypothetical protein